MLKNDFPIFENNPWLVYLDSAATVQKPKQVIDWIKLYLENDYANIHRGDYSLSERSEEMFWQSRKTVADWMDVEPEEVIFTWNATGASNLLVQSLEVSWMIQSWDTIMISEWEHHANIVPRQMVCERVWCTIIWIPLLENWSINLDRLAQNTDATVRVVAITAISNVTWTSNHIEEIKSVIDDSTYLVVDASQAIAHIPVLPHKRWCDFCRWTWHKMWALTWIGVLRWSKNLLKKMTPSIGWWWSIDSVSKDWYSLLWSPDKFEPWTPNLTGVLSIKLAMEYLKSKAESKNMNVYTMIEDLERPMIEYCLEQFSLLEEKGIELLWSKKPGWRVGVFSFMLPKSRSIGSLWERMWQDNICIRCWAQCAHPYHAQLWKMWTCRLSLWIYNDLNDCKKFFEVLKKFLW